MRRLIYIPIIHTDPDLGRLAEGIEEQAEKVVGSDNWQKHKQVVRRYWQKIANYWEGKKVLGMKIFQDGLAANGEIGKKIVKELADKGSVNHQIVKKLLEKKAELVKTEDPELLKEEYFLTRELIKRRLFLGSLLAFFRYKWRKNKLLQERDAYIIKQIDKSLQEGETGVCFLGAYHKVLTSLPKDILVITLKDPAKVKEYYQKFTTHVWEGEINSLARYLTKPIKIHLGKKYD
jgi:hypothetical protein